MKIRITIENRDTGQDIIRDFDTKIANSICENVEEMIKSLENIELEKPAPYPFPF